MTPIFNFFNPLRYFQKLHTHFVFQLPQSEFVSTLINFTSSFNCLALNDTEIGLFSAVVLLTPDRSGITDIKMIEQHQDRLMDALKLQVSVMVPRLAR